MNRITETLRPILQDLSKANRQEAIFIVSAITIGTLADSLVQSILTKLSSYVSEQGSKRLNQCVNLLPLSVIALYLGMASGQLAKVLTVHQMIAVGTLSVVTRCLLASVRSSKCEVLEQATAETRKTKTPRQEDSVQTIQNPNPIQTSKGFQSPSATHRIASAIQLASSKKEPGSPFPFLLSPGLLSPSRDLTPKQTCPLSEVVKSSQNFSEDASENSQPLSLINRKTPQISQSSLDDSQAEDFFLFDEDKSVTPVASVQRIQNLCQISNDFQSPSATHRIASGSSRATGSPSFQIADTNVKALKKANELLNSQLPSPIHRKTSKSSSEDISERFVSFFVENESDYSSEEEENLAEGDSFVSETSWDGSTYLLGLDQIPPKNDTPLASNSIGQPIDAKPKETALNAEGNKENIKQTVQQINPQNDTSHKLILRGRGSQVSSPGITGSIKVLWGLWKH